MAICLCRYIYIYILNIPILIYFNLSVCGISYSHSLFYCYSILILSNKVHALWKSSKFCKSMYIDNLCVCVCEYICVWWQLMLLLLFDLKWRCFLVQIHINTASIQIRLDLFWNLCKVIHGTNGNRIPFESAAECTFNTIL